MTIVIMTCLVLLAAAKLINPNRFQEFLMLVFTNKYFLVHGKSKEIATPFNIFLFGVQILSVSLFLYLLILAVKPGFAQSTNYLFVLVVSAYTLFIGFKFCIEKIVANLFSIDDLIDSYLYQKLSYRNLFAVFLLAANILFIYSLPENETMMLVFLGIVLLANVLALVYSYRTNEKWIINNFFYFILYLCALEISPYIILYKAVT